MPHPTAFISYSYDSEDHKRWVLKLATDLRGLGIDVTLDQWDLVLGQDLSVFMQNGIVHSDRVIMICSDKYVKKAEAGSGGVGFERLIVTSEIVQNIETTKFIPAIRDSNGTSKVPNFLGPRKYVNFDEDSLYTTALEELARDISGAYQLTKPPLGESAFSALATPSATEPVAIGPTGFTSAGSVLDSQWFAEQHNKAVDALTAEKYLGSMEIRIGLHAPITKSQVELLRAVEAAQVKTFGWPIGIVLGSRDEFRPRPYGDGIRAEINIKEGGSFVSRRSYDLWALAKAGQFYLNQDYFEDERSEGKIFFNTRIIRITEALMFSRKLYSNLGVPDAVGFTMRAVHSGLSGRTLTSASFNRHILERTCSENTITTEISSQVGQIEAELPMLVKQLCAPMFMLFDFMEFGDNIYEDIVRRFEKGEAT